MPHQCTNCGRTFADGSKEMLSGCPDCGGNKFQFRPAGAQQEATVEADTTSSDAEQQPDAGSAPATDPEPASEPASAADPEPAATDAAPPEPEGSTAASDDGDDGIVDADARESDRPDWAGTGARPTPGEESPSPSGEDNAQKDARSSIASSDELDRARELMAQAERERMEQVESGDESGTAADTETVTGSETTTDSEVTTDSETATGSEATTGSETTTESHTEAAPVESARGSDPSASGAPDQATQGGADRTTPDSPGSQPPADDAADSSQDVSGPIGDSSTASTDTEAEVVDTPEDPDLDALRKELNNQFESIKIVAPGQYELNLMELYDRQEYIISLREDGRYVIEVPDSWHGDE